MRAGSSLSTLDRDPYHGKRLGNLGDRTGSGVGVDWDCDRSVVCYVRPDAGDKTSKHSASRVEKQGREEVYSL